MFVRLSNEECEALRSWHRNKTSLAPFNEVRSCVSSEVFPGLIETSKPSLLQSDSHHINDRLLLKKTVSLSRFCDSCFLLFVECQRVLRVF